MKRIISVFAAVALVTALSSCRVKEKCPAYGKIDQQKAQKTAHI